MHADTDTGADVTALALARCEAAAALAAKVAGDQAYHPFWRAAIESVDVPLLAAIAAAAVRLTAAMTLTPDTPWWATYAEAAEPWGCAGCGGGSDRWDRLTHADNCPALALDAAIRAAGEAGT